MIRSYKILFKVELNHAYYTNGVSRDFDVYPTQETIAWLHENNMVFRIDETGFRVFYTNTQNSDPPVPFTSFDAVQLRFMLFLKNKEIFFNITDLTIGTEVYTAGQLLLMKNNNFEEELDISLIDGVKPFNFSYTFPQVATAPTTDKGQIEITDPSGRDVTPSSPDPQQILPNQQGIFSYPLDLTGFPKGEYQFKTWVNNLNSVEKQIYIDNRILAQKPFGLIAIDLPSSVNNFQPNKVFKAELNEKEPTWKYFFLMKNLAPSTDYSVIAKDLPYTFTAKDSVEINGITTLVFESDQEIPLSEIPLNSIQFLNASSEVLIDGLSNPVVNVISSSPGNPEAYNIYVNV